MTRCATCGARNPADARFCSSCGAARAEAPPPQEERRLVSVLFVDLVDSTARAGRDAEHLDEVARARRDGFETAIRIDDTAPYIAVRALDADGEQLATSDTVGVVAGGA